MGMGCLAGGIGSFVGNPCELAMVRLSADGKKPVEERRHYKNVFDCMFRVAKEEGVSSLWNGATPTVLRAMVLSSTVLTTYSEAKLWLVKTSPTIFPSTDTLGCQFVGTSMAAFVANMFCVPFDVIKSRVQDGNQYKGMVDCVRKSVAAEGPMVLYKGYIPALVKLAPCEYMAAATEWRLGDPKPTPFVLMFPSLFCLALTLALGLGFAQCASCSLPATARHDAIADAHGEVHHDVDGREGWLLNEGPRGWIFLQRGARGLRERAQGLTEGAKRGRPEFRTSTPMRGYVRMRGMAGGSPMCLRREAPGEVNNRRAGGWAGGLEMSTRALYGYARAEGRRRA